MNGEDFQIREINPQTGYIPPQIPQRGGGLASMFNRKNLPKTIFFIIVVAFLIAVIAIIWGQFSFSKAKVLINIKAPQDIASGKEIILTVEYQNNNRVNLNDTYLIMEYPSGVFSPEGKEIYREQRSLKTILRKSSGRQEFEVRLVGDKGEFKNITAKLEYQPKNINSRFESETSSRVEINSVLIAIKIDGPDNAMSGQDVSYLIEYENKTSKDIPDLQILADYNKDLKIKSINPKPIEETNNKWQINTLRAGEKRSINITGTLEGDEGEDKILKITIGTIENKELLQYSRLEHTTRIASSPLLLMINPENFEGENCIVSPGQQLMYRLEFRNNTDVALKELILKTYFDDSVFDFKSINLNGVGFFDGRENTVTWAGGEISLLKLLEPNQSGNVRFSIDLKKHMPMNSYNDKNFQARISSEIGTLTVPAKFAISELKINKELTCKINSKLEIKSKVYYYEPASGIINTGPLPPKVNELTTYTVHWQITNGSNDLENVRVTATLPQGIDWSNYYINNVSNSQVYYNERTKEIVWEIQKIPAGTGFILPVYELIFQIGLRPSINQIGQEPILINQTSAEGKDIFTNVILTDTSSAVSTAIPDDPRAAYVKGRVVE